MSQASAYHRTNEPHEECKKKIKSDKKAEETSDV